MLLKRVKKSRNLPINVFEFKLSQQPKKLVDSVTKKTYFEIDVLESKSLSGFNKNSFLFRSTLI